MSQVENQVQQKLVIFCKYLGEHVGKWRLILQESTKAVESLCNQAEQLRHVERPYIKDMPDFERTQNILLASILDGIETEIFTIKKLLEKLNLANQELKNKLTAFENATTDLDWEVECPLVKGTPTQPPLAMLLSESLKFWLFFKGALRNMNESFKAIDTREWISMLSLEKTFKFDLEDDCILNLIALTQYVANENF